MTLERPPRPSVSMELRRRSIGASSTVPAALQDRVADALTCIICLEVAQIPVNITCFNCGGKGGCLRTLVCQQCANRALQLDVPTGKRFVDAHGMARCLVCRETQVVASQLGPDRAYSINYNVMDLMDILGVQATCRPCQQDFPSQIALQQHYLKQCPQAVVTCRFKGCGYSAPRHVLEPHEEMCPVGRARCVQCGVLVDQSDLLTHMVAKCKNRVVNCMLCSYSTRLPEMLQHLRGHQEMLLMQQQRQRQQQQQAVATAAQQEQHAANAAQEQAATQQQAAAAARASLPPIGASPGSGGMTVGAALAAVQEVLARTSSRRSDGGLSTAAAAGSSRGSSTSGGILAGVVPGGDRTSAMLQQRRQSDPATTLPRLGSRGVERLPSHGAYHNGDGGQGSAAAAGGSGTAEPSSDDGARFTPPRMRHSDGGALHLQRSAAGPAAASPPMASPWYSASGQRSLAGSSSSLVQGTGSHDGTVPGPATPPPLVVGAVAPNGTRGQAARSHDGAGGEQAGSSLLPPLLEHASPTAMSPSMQARVAYTMMRGPAGAPLSPSRRLLATTVSRRRDLAPSVPAGRAAADAPGGAAGDDLDSDRHTGDPPPPPPQPLASYRRSLSTSSAMMTDCEEMAVAAADGTLEVVAAEGLAAGAQSEHLASLPPLRVSMPGGC